MALKPVNEGGTETNVQNQSTEDEILAGIEGIDESEDQGQEQPQGSQEQTQEGDKQTQEGDGTKTQTAGDGKTTGDGAKDQQTNKQTTGPQDLVDAQGNVIARGGAERRLYENLQKTNSNLQTVTRERDDLKTRVEAFEKANSIGNELGLNSEEVVTGANLMAAWKRSPPELVKYLWTQAQAGGHNIDLGQGQGGGVDVAAIKQMVSEAVKPLIDKERQSDTQTQEQAQAKQIYDDFLGRHPDAEVHAESIAQLMSENEDLGLEAAYFALRSFYMERGLDWTKPVSTLRQEALSKQQADGGSGGNQTQQLPNGQGNTSNDASLDVDDVSSADASFDEIIRQSMKDAGYRQ